jgi:hypothetical protein
VSELLPLAVLALIDSTSFGTLVIPLWLMISPGLRAGRVLAYLGIVAVAYCALGLALLAGATSLMDEAGEVADSKPAQVVALVAGVVLMVLGITIEPWTKAGKARKAERRAQRRAARGPGRMERWRSRINSGHLAVSALASLALVAVAVEAASMVPYLAAVGIVTTASLAPVTASAVMAAYCVVMVAPALVLLVLRIVLRQRIEPTLVRVEAWIAKNSREALAWVLFLVGLYVAGGAWNALGG